MINYKIVLLANKYRNDPDQMYIKKDTYLSYLF